MLFSSAAATFGGAGQGNYAAANAFLDALAQQRAGRGPGRAVGGLGAVGGRDGQANEAVRQRMRRGSLPEMDPGLAVRALGQALEGGDSLLAVMDVDWSRFAASPGPFLRDLPDAARPGPAGQCRRGAVSWPSGGLARRLAGAAQGQAGPGAGRPDPGRGRRGARPRLRRGDRGRTGRSATWASTR